MRAFTATEAEPAIRDLQEAGGAGLDDSEPGTFAKAEFREAANPSGVAGDLGHLGVFAGPHHVQRKQHGRNVY